MQPEDFDADYTFRLPHADVCELIAGRGPHDVVVLCLSAVRAITEPIQETMTKPKRKRKTQQEAAA